MKKRYLTLAVALLLVVACCVPVSASEEVINNMGSCIIYNENNVYQGDCQLWNDSLYEFTLGGDISAVTYSNLYMTLTISYNHYDTYEEKTHSGFAFDSNVYTLNDTIYISPNEGTPYYGSGSFTIGECEGTAGGTWIH